MFISSNNSIDPFSNYVVAFVITNIMSIIILVTYRKLTNKQAIRSTKPSRQTQNLECDYLVIGAGATGMAFVDELLHLDRDVTVILVDKRAKPGGHWVDSYPFVRLHQPSAWYGVNSRALGTGGADLATKSQILAYYELVMEDLKLTGRMSYFSQCEYVGEGIFKSLLQEDLEYHVKFSRKIVDATLMLTHCPATKPPEYGISDNVNVVPINHLTQITTPPKIYIVIGAGKTGIDAILYLIENNVDPKNIVWIVPNDSWYICRDRWEDLNNLSNQILSIFDIVIEATDINDVYRKGEKLGHYIRLDKNIWPTRMRAATMSSKELEKVLRVGKIIRRGRIDRIESNAIIFKNNDVISTERNTLYIDCSTAGSNFPPVKEKIFDGHLINLQMVQIPPSATSAAMIAAIELTLPDEEDKKNMICKPFNAPQLPTDWFRFNYLSYTNGDKIRKTLGIKWMRNCRLTPLHHMPLISFIKTIIYTVGSSTKITEKLKLFSEQVDLYGKILE